MIEKRFFIAPFINMGKPILQIRRSIVDRNEINKILKVILKEGEIKIVATVKFRDPLSARIRLKELELLPLGLESAAVPLSAAHAPESAEAHDDTENNKNDNGQNDNR